jgi:hypothetical protein
MPATRGTDDRVHGPSSIDQEGTAGRPKELLDAVRRLRDAEHRKSRVAINSARYDELAAEVEALRDVVVRIARETAEDLTGAQAEAEGEDTPPNVQRFPGRRPR